MMSRAFLAPRELLARKPPHGQACTSCGLCCVATLCEIGRSIYHKTAGPCPALDFDKDGKSACGVLLAAEDRSPELGKAVALMIRAGQGCDARFNGEPKDFAFDAGLDALDMAQRDEIDAARDLLNLPPLSR